MSAPEEFRPRVRRARPSDAQAIKELIDRNAEQEILLPRSLDDIVRHIDRFSVASVGPHIAGAGAVHRYSSRLAEVRSLAVRPSLKGRGIGGLILDSLARRAGRAGVESLFVMTLVPDFFELHGFRRVDHESLPEKVWKDCIACPRRQSCNEIALARDLRPARLPAGPGQKQAARPAPVAGSDPSITPWRALDGDVTTPGGFSAGAVNAGVKPGTSRLDLGLLVSTLPASGAAVFTRNRVAAAPVTVSRRRLRLCRGRVAAIVVNSGNANACTGPVGLAAADRMADRIASELRTPPTGVLVASTGVIGLPLPIERIEQAIPALVGSVSTMAGRDFSQAIMTTDTRLKRAAVHGRLDGRVVHIGGVAKGAGMIRPDMATMLAFVTTDAAIAPTLMRIALRESAAASFNRITVDGDTSTNDSLFLLANGASGAPAIDRPGAALDWFKAGLRHVCLSLARQIAADGEGATKLIEVRVSGGRTQAEADRVARTIASSPLVRTAVAGADANWGRIICAAGYSGAPVDPSAIDIAIDGVPLCRNGAGIDFDEAAARRALEKPEVYLQIDLNRGSASAVIWTCDLTEGYIRENASYRS